MRHTTPQMGKWAGNFGRAYTERNPHTPSELDELYLANFGLLRSNLNEDFLGKLDRSMKILEVGCNVGVQLMALAEMEFTNLYGVELQRYALVKAKEKRPGINYVQGSAFQLPFPDNAFDSVFTSGMLIHISPDDIQTVLREVCRCSRKYIWGWEYYSGEYEQIPYRGHDDLMWKADFAQLFMETFPDLELTNERKVPHLHGDNIDIMYMLEKKQGA